MKDAKLYGVIECMNAPYGMAFREDHMVIVEDLAKTLGTAFSNHMRNAVRTSPFDSLIRAGKLSQEQVDQATQMGQKNGFSTEQSLILNLKIPRRTWGGASPSSTAPPSWPIPPATCRPSSTWRSSRSIT
jgi:hypothetical protein